MMSEVQKHSCCNAVEISQSEYKRLSMKGTPDNRFANFQAEKERLRKISANRASKWPNTLINLRLLREQARRDRIKKEEQDIITQDKENMEFRHKERLDKISKANSLLEKPHVRVLQSQAWATDVTKERDEQIKLSKIWKDKWAKNDNYYHQEMLKTVANLSKIEEDKTKETYSNNQLWIKAQNDQVALIHKRLLKEKDDQLRERVKLDKELADADEKDAAKRKAKKDHLLATIGDIAKINRSIQENKAMLAAKEQTIDKEIATYWVKRKAWIAGLKKINDEKFAAKRKREEVMAERLDKLYKALAKKVEEDEEKYRIAKEKAEDEYWAKKKAKEKALLAECHMAQQLQIKKKKEKLEEEKEIFLQESELVAKHIQQLIEEENQENIKKYNYNRKIAEFCIEQKNKKKEAEKIAKETNLNEDIEALIQLKADEEYLKNLKFE